MAMVCKKAIVSGKVQGVFYRKSCQQQALTLGVTGYAKNLSNGDVEVTVCGPAANVEKLITWLNLGPAASRVEKVRVEEADETNFTTFAVY